MKSICIPVTWQLVVITHDGKKHLFQAHDTLPTIPAVGLLLADVPGIPAVLGPAASCDNIIHRVLYNGGTGRVMCQLQGYRAATETLEEVKAVLCKNTDWEYITCLADDSVRETGPKDMLG